MSSTMGFDTVAEPPDHLADELESSFDAAVRCPAGVYNKYEDIRGCGSFDVYGPDENGCYECRDCGLYFAVGGFDDDGE